MSSPSGGSSLRRLLSSFTHLAERVVAHESVWDRVAIDVPASVFGCGSHEPFAVYFEGKSSVRVESIDDIVTWLHTCEYVSDLELFHEGDVWQHPDVFEQRKRGDCEDFALWAWRKLAELGIDAEFCVGRAIASDGPENDRQHAWVLYRVDDIAFLFEPAARTADAMIRLLNEAMCDYVPHFAVNRRFETTAFAGCAPHTAS